MAVSKCIKYSLFFFNLLFWISGCIILGVSIYLKVSKDNNKITDVAVPGIDLLIAIGVIIMVLGFLGCCGAIKENKCMLLLFFIGLLLIFILLLAAGILGAVGEEKSKQWVREKLQKLLPLSSQPADVQTDLQALEEKAKCCGLINGAQDWGSSIPSSCSCTDTSASCEMVGGKNVYKTPCIQFVTDFMQQHLTVALGIAFAIAVVMLFGMAFAMTLYCQIGKVESSTA
ncbi:tetraspanin-8-like [Megalops cyprinoides]|uniref:tetraspanin-8-like n=1 Tax=Megalops cyprinoides TaxID=118141 RepID=UPI001865404F|nr:tetraspanin-8-like [Megalops cyprinoides]